MLGLITRRRRRRVFLRGGRDALCADDDRRNDEGEKQEGREAKPLHKAPQGHFDTLYRGRQGEADRVLYTRFSAFLMVPRSFWIFSCSNVIA